MTYEVGEGEEHLYGKERLKCKKRTEKEKREVLEVKTSNVKKERGRWILTEGTD